MTTPNHQLLNDLTDPYGYIRIQKKQGAHQFYLQMQSYADAGGLLRYIPGYTKLKKSLDTLGKFDSQSDLAALKGLLGKVLPKVAKRLGAVVSIVGDLSSTCYLAMGAGAEIVAQDPPRQDYGAVTQPSFPPGVHISARERRHKAVAAALNALVANTDHFTGENNAYLLAYERLQGAAAASNSAGIALQAGAAATFARAEAADLTARPRLRTALAKALRRAIGGRFAITAHGQRLLSQAVKRKGTTSKLRIYLEHMGLDGATANRDVRSLRQSLRGPQSKTPLIFPDMIAPPAAAKADETLAASMSDMASKLETVAKG